MNKIFKRPMFRKGGPVNDGIMTGIVDRENHALSDPEGVGGQSNRERIMEAYDKYPNQDFDPLTQFLLEYGPSLAGTTGGGSTLGNVLLASKGPLKNLITNKGAENRAKRKIAMEGEILDIEGDIKKDVAQIQQRGALDIKKEYLDNVYDIKRKEAAGNVDLLKKIEDDYQNDLNLFIVKGFDVSDVYNVIKGDEVQSVILGQAENYIKNNLDTLGLTGEDDPKYGPTLLSVMAEFTKTYGDKLRSGIATGGRVGYAMGTPENNQKNITQTPVVVGSKNVTNNPQIEITYDELRSRLPKEISDEVVKVLSTSYEALADFAELRTQADVDAFNSRYGVSLVLPQEA
jgi:hypothetical protein